MLGLKCATPIFVVTRIQRFLPYPDVVLLFLVGREVAWTGSTVMLPAPVQTYATSTRLCRQTYVARRRSQESGSPV